MRLVPFLFIIFIFAGCTQYDKLVYLQNDIEADSLEHASYDHYKLQEGDLLHIKVYSTDAQVNQLFNLNDNQQRTNYNDISLYLEGFELDDSCNIELPIIGKINLKDQTLKEANAIVRDSVISYINNAIVKVKLISYRVTVFGEVKNPGVIKVYRNQSNIFEVLSLAGDVKTLGNREEIEVLRQTKNGRKKIEIDLTQFSSIQNPAYNIYPNDIIYVKPHRSKVFRDNFPVISLTLSTLTTFLLILNYFQ